MNKPSPPAGPARDYHPAVLVNGQVREPNVPEVCAVLPLLDRYFLDHHYSPGWSDEEIANKTGIPRLLVQKIRIGSPDHGEITANPEIARLWKEIETLEQLLGDFKQRLTRLEQGATREGR